MSYCTRLVCYCNCLWHRQDESRAPSERQSESAGAPPCAAVVLASSRGLVAPKCICGCSIDTSHESPRTEAFLDPALRGQRRPAPEPVCSGRAGCRALSSAITCTSAQRKGGPDRVAVSLVLRLSHRDLYFMLAWHTTTGYMIRSEQPPPARGGRGEAPPGCQRRRRCHRWRHHPRQPLASCQVAL